MESKLVCETKLVSESKLVSETKLVSESKLVGETKLGRVLGGPRHYRILVPGNPEPTHAKRGPRVGGDSLCWGKPRRLGSRVWRGSGPPRPAVESETA